MVLEYTKDIFPYKIKLFVLSGFFKSYFKLPFRNGFPLNFISNEYL